MAILVTRGMHDGGVTAFGYRQEVVRRGGRLDRVDRDLHSAVGAVLEPDRTRQPRRQLPVNLAFGGAGPDRPPRDQIGDVLRRDHIEVLGTCGQLELVDLEQDAPSQPQAFVDAKAVVEPRVVDKTLPADGRSGLFEVHPHDDDEVVCKLALQRRQARRIIDRRIIVVDGAWADDDQQAIVRAVQHAMDRGSRLVGCRRGSIGGRKFAQEMGRWRELHDLADARVVDRQPGAGAGRGGCLAAMGGGGGHSELPWGLGDFSMQKHHFTGEGVGGYTILTQPMLHCTMSFCDTIGGQ